MSQGGPACSWVGTSSSVGDVVRRVRREVLWASPLVALAAAELGGELDEGYRPPPQWVTCSAVNPGLSVTAAPQLIYLRARERREAS